MDTLTFISNLIEHLIWPVTLFLVLLVIVRKAPEISQLIQRIKFKDIEVTFREILIEAKDTAYKLQDSHKTVLFKHLKLDKSIQKIAKIDPTMAIFKSWQKLETKLIDSLRHNGMVRFGSIEDFIKQLEELEKISYREARLFEKLRLIKNDIVRHAPYGFLKEPTYAEAIEYYDLVTMFTQILDRIMEEPGYIDIPKKQDPNVN